MPEQEHQANLTRAEITSAVHYVRFRFTQEQIEAFAAEPVRLAVNHPAYPDGVPGTVLADATSAELARTCGESRPGRPDHAPGPPFGTIRGQL